MTTTLPGSRKRSRGRSSIGGRASVAAELRRHGTVGDRAAIVAPQGLDYIVGLLGAFEAGLIAVPLSVPHVRAHDERVNRVLVRLCTRRRADHLCRVRRSCRVLARARTRVQIAVRRGRQGRISATHRDSPAWPALRHGVTAVHLGIDASAGRRDGVPSQTWSRTSTGDDRLLQRHRWRRSPGSTGFLAAVLPRYGTFHRRSSHRFSPNMQAC